MYRLARHQGGYIRVYFPVLVLHRSFYNIWYGTKHVIGGVLDWHKTDFPVICVSLNTRAALPPSDTERFQNPHGAIWSVL